jgi:hypothetical protein
MKLPVQLLYIKNVFFQKWRIGRYDWSCLGVGTSEKEGIEGKDIEW